MADCSDSFQISRAVGEGKILSPYVYPAFVCSEALSSTTVPVIGQAEIVLGNNLLLS